jgi:hypothetical protein
MIRKALNAASIRDRSIILTAFQSGMDDSTLSEVFNFYGYPQLVKEFGTEDWRFWDTEKCPVKVILTRPKSQYRYYSFLDVDAIEALKAYLDVRGERIRVYPSDNRCLMRKSDPIYVARQDRPINPGVVNSVFREVGKRAGVNISSGASLEELR